MTGFALALGTVVTSAMVVEGIFALPGIGTLLQRAIQANDFPGDLWHRAVHHDRHGGADGADGVHLSAARPAHSAQ